MNYDEALNKIKEIKSNTGESDFLDACIEFLYKNFDNYNWIGAYIVDKDNLVLGPWRGNQATEHIKIPIGKGICGSAAETGNTEIVSDVKSDDRYLACFLSTKSEIVVPIKKNGRIIGEIDIDSDNKDAFSKEDKVFLEKISDMLSEHI